MVEFVCISIPFLSNTLYAKNVHAIYHKLLAFRVTAK